ncbi:hypothetical protein [Streptosporangium sp. KLBMP 9127]|nr:hypothetical protein [Streptosporangium sp. KLBMP 9127]
MDERPHEPQPFGERVWPPEREEAAEPLPPSARWYGAPAPPVRRRMPRWAGRAVIVCVALVAGAALIAGTVVVVLRTVAPESPATVIVDALAGVRYPLPPGWQEGALAPVTAFTSIASKAAAPDVPNGGQALVMVRPGPAIGARSLREVTLELTDLYSRLLLHGDAVDIVDDLSASVGGFPAHRRSLRAEYEDVVNRPAYLRVVVLDRGERTVVVVALAQPDDPVARRGIDAIVSGVRA